MTALAEIRPDPRLMERLVTRIRAYDGNVSAWISGGEALALALLGAGSGPMPTWADDLADTMVGALLRVVDRTAQTAPAAERVALATAAVTLSVVRPHATYVLDGAIDAWLGWTPERPRPEHGSKILAPWTMLDLLRGDLDGAADAVHSLIGADQTALGLLLHDWAVARIQGLGPEREAVCFHTLRAALPDSETHDPGLLVVAAATAVTAAGLRRADVRPWLAEVAGELARDGTARATPVPMRQR